MLQDTQLQGVPLSALLRSLSPSVLGKNQARLSMPGQMPELEEPELGGLGSLADYAMKLFGTGGKKIMSPVSLLGGM
jgi:hypothetical protein